MIDPTDDAKYMTRAIRTPTEPSMLVLRLADEFLQMRPL